MQEKQSVGSLSNQEMAVYTRSIQYNSLPLTFQRNKSKFSL